MGTASGFTGWSPAAAEFYRGLEADNSREYWLAHKSVYEQEVLAPMQALLEELAPEFGEAKIFRPNRDIRFSADKSPYKTAIGALMDRGYAHFSADGLGVGAGCHMMAPDQLERFRSAILDDTTGPELRSAIAVVEGRGIGVITHDSLKSVPRGFDKEHPRADLLRRKDLTVWKEWPASTDWIATPEAAVHVAETLRAARPVTDWLDENVGSSTLERRR